MAEPTTGTSEGAEKRASLRDGRYTGGGEEIYVDLRVDVHDLGVISGDVHRLAGDQHHYVASFRTAPGLRAEPEGGRWAAAWADSLGGPATGAISVQPVADLTDVLEVALRLDRRLNGLPPGRDMIVTVERAGGDLRTLGVEIESEEGVRPHGQVVFQGAAQSLEECLRGAGFEVVEAGVASAIPRQPAKWSTANEFAVLHDLMRATAAGRLDIRAWELHLLLLSASDFDGLLGVMFDAADLLPRQGVAIFVDEIRARLPDDVEDRKILQTTVHEVGHALNLAHRFEREVGRADSTSFMNYDWRYKGGRKEKQFWERFSFTFDPDELEFLRHAPRVALIPGGAAFHSVNYWSEGTGGYSPYYPEFPLPGFRLTLAPPAAGPVFAFGQPVFLEVALENRTAAEVPLPPQILDAKAGFLEILVRRHFGTSARGLADAVPFVPMMQRCYDLETSDGEMLPPGGTLTNNVNVTFGSSGFPFAEPGAYDVIPLLSLQRVDEQGDRIDQVILGEALQIRIAHPQNLHEEREAGVLLRPDVGAWFALGGSHALDGARDALEEIRERREAAAGPADPLVATIVRAAALDAGRPAVRYLDGRFQQFPADPERAAGLLARLDDAALRNFDPHTARRTAGLSFG